MAENGSIGFEKELWNAADQLRVAVRRVLKQYKCPPEYEKAAAAAVMAQAERTANDVLA